MISVGLHQVKSTYFPRYLLTSAESKGSEAQTGTRTFFKADYVRLKNVAVYYDLSPSLVKKAGLSSFRFYVQGTNLWTASDWFSYDIEFVGTSLVLFHKLRTTPWVFRLDSNF